MQMHWKILNWATNVRICYLSKYSKYVEGLQINMSHFISTMVCSVSWLNISLAWLLTEGWKLSYHKCEIGGVIQMEWMVCINTTLCIDHIHLSVTHCGSFLVVPLYLLLFWFYSGCVYIYTLTHTSQIQVWNFASEHSTAY